MSQFEDPPRTSRRRASRLSAAVRFIAGARFGRRICPDCEGKLAISTYPLDPEDKVGCGPAQLEAGISVQTYREKRRERERAAARAAALAAEESAARAQIAGPELPEVAIVDAKQHAGPSLWESVRRHPVLVAIPAILAFAAGGSAGYARSPVYTATVPMVISQVTSSTPGGLTGYAQAGPELADAYSRMVTAQTVLSQVASQLHLRAGDLSNRLSAGPVPGSPVFYIRGSASNGAEAVLLANTASIELVRFVQVISEPSPTPGTLLTQFQNAQQQLQVALRAVVLAQASYNVSKTAAASAAVDRARARAQTVRLRASSLETSYRQALANSTAATNLRVIAPATAATSDRRSSIELLGVLGLTSGLVLGLALAMLVGARRARRV